MSDEPNNITLLITGLVSGIQDAETALQQLLTLRSLGFGGKPPTAQGAQLDALGKLVGQARAGLDDATYAQYISARVATDRSNGLVSDLITIISLILNDSSATITITQEGTATARVLIGGIAVTDALAAIIFSFIEEGKSAGVRILLGWGDVVPADLFTLDIGPGLDQGHLAGGLG